jgi:segregation and condensation protein A
MEEEADNNSQIDNLVEQAFPIETNSNQSSQNPQVPSVGTLEHTAVQRVGQEQIHGLLFGEKLSWQAIIYDLINSEQLDPWDIDLSLLAEKFLERVRQFEEANFFVSSKVLLAAALLLRMKSELLLNRDLPGLDAVLFGKKEEKKYLQEKITLQEAIPELVVRTPLPRYKKVSLDELMAALSHAIKTETRRIRRIVITKQQEFETSLSMPKKRINLQDSIKDIYDQLQGIFSKREHKLAFSDLTGKDASPEVRVSTFIPLLHLDNQQKVWLEQEGHFAEIWILLKHLYEQQNKDLLEQLRLEAEQGMKDFDEEQKKRAKELEKEVGNPLEDDDEDEQTKERFSDRRPKKVEDEDEE